MENRIVGAHELRAVETSKGLQISGYAARYNVLSHPLPGGGGRTFRERIAKRAFDGILRTSPDVCALVNHDPNLIIGRTSSGTLRLNSDDSGLRFECDLPNTTVGRDLHESIRRGDAAGCSFAFGPFQDGDEDWTNEEDETRAMVLVRTIKNFRRLHDVSVITGSTPAYPGTSVDARKELVAAEVRSYVQQLFSAKPTPPRKFHCPIFCRAIEQLRAYNLEHATSLSLGDLHDLADRRRKRMLQDILD